MYLAIKGGETQCLPDLHPLMGKNLCCANLDELSFQDISSKYAQHSVFIIK